MKWIVLVLTFLLVSCSDKPPHWNYDGVLPPLTDKANDVCSKNDGLKMISNPRHRKEYVSCGDGCWKEDGIRLSGTVVCNNTAVFKLYFHEKGINDD